jgi:hypothetical protein
VIYYVVDVRDLKRTIMCWVVLSDGPQVRFINTMTSEDFIFNTIFNEIQMWQITLEKIVWCHDNLWLVIYSMRSQTKTCNSNDHDIVHSPQIIQDGSQINNVFRTHECLQNSVVINFHSDADVQLAYSAWYLEII